MRTFLMLIALFIATQAHSAPIIEVPANVPQDNWSIIKNSPLFSLSAEFECKRGDTVDGKVIRSGLFTPRYFYDFYDSYEGFQARGITRVFSWGFFYPWGMEIDVYGDDNIIGKIEGKLFTKARSKFVFYDAVGHETAVAYLNAESSDFLIVSFPDETKILADLKGESYGDVSRWDMNFIQPLRVDPRILKIFAAFVADYHDSFLPRRDINVYYFNNGSQNGN